MRLTNYQKIREIVLFEDPEILDFYENEDLLFESLIVDLYGPASSEVLRSIHRSIDY